jgi:hypothetical protein
MKQTGRAPEKNTSEWRRNEKIINDTPALKSLRDISEGFTPSSASGSRVAGGSEAYKAGWDRIFGNKDPEDLQDE